MALAPRAALAGAAPRGAELAARAEAGTAPASDKPARSYDLNKPARGAGEDKGPRKPRREVTVKFEELAVGKAYKGTVVRRRAAPERPQPGVPDGCELGHAGGAAAAHARAAPRSRASPRTAPSSTSAPPRTASRTSPRCRCARAARRSRTRRRRAPRAPARRHAPRRDTPGAPAPAPRRPRAALTRAAAAALARRAHVRLRRRQDEFVQDVSELLQVGQEVTAYVLNVDAEKKRFGLSLKEPRADSEGDAGGEGAPGGRGKVATRPSAKGAKAADKKPLTIKRGDWVEGTVLTVLPYGAVVEVEEGVSGLLHISEMSGARAPGAAALRCCSAACCAMRMLRVRACVLTLLRCGVRVPQTSRMPSRRTSSRRRARCACASTTSTRTTRSASP